MKFYSNIYCEFQCREILLTQQLNINHKKHDYNIYYII